MLRGPNITLRLMRADDVEQLAELLNDHTEAGEFGVLGLRPAATWRKQFEEDGWWGENKGLLLITREERMIGEIVFFEGMRHEAGYEVGYEIFRREDRGHGYGTKALRIFSAYLFAAKPIQRLHLNMRADNTASRRIAEKCGYVHEGTLRRFSFDRGQFHDAVIMSLLRDDCPALERVLA